MPYLPFPTRRATARRITLGCLAVTALAVSACSSARSDTPGGGSTGTGGGGGGGGGAVVAKAKASLAKYSGEVSSYDAVKAIPGGVKSLKGKTVWYVPIGSAVPILNAFGSGVEQAVTKIGMRYKTCDGKFLPTTISQCLSQAASQGADAVITGYIDYALVPNAFDNLVAKNIPVLVAGEKPSAGKSDSPKLAFYDTTKTIELLQKLGADAIIADSGGKAKVLYIGVDDSPQTKQAAIFAKKYFAQACKECTYKEISYNTASLNKVPSQVSSALIANPETTYVFPALDAGAPGALSGIQTAGYSNKVKLASTNGALDSVQRVKAGNVQFADIGFSPIYAGWQFTDGILRMMTGGTPVPTTGIVRAFTKDNVGDLELTPKAYATNDWYGSDDFEKTFLTAWGAN
ncbi:sugar ABC transporter substrate-binding protein [Jatrophihabitans fulvus]